MSVLKKKKNRASERGVALVIALLVLLLLSTVVAGMMIMSTTETTISANFRDEQTAFFAARAGLEEVRDRLRSTATNSLNGSLPTALPGGANSVLYVTNPLPGETVTPANTTGKKNKKVHSDDEICKHLKKCPNAGYSTNGSASTSYAAKQTLPWKWVRIMVKANGAATGPAGIATVDGTTTVNRVCWNGTNEVVTTNATCGGNAPVYEITALAVTASGARRMLEYEETINVNVPIVAAIYAKNGIDTGQALNVTGNTEAGCSANSTYGAASGTANVTTPGGGNVTGTPAGTINNYGWSVNVTALINGLSYGATDITTLPAVSQDSSTPPNITIPSAVLGTVPTGKNPTPITYITPDLYVPGTNPPVYNTLTLGGGTGVTGYGVLIVRGNLVIDASPTLDYYGLIIVEGNLTIKSSSSSPVNPLIHGALIVGGSFSAPMSNMNGSVSIRQNACMVQNVIAGQFYKTVAQRELIY
jgi:Tfp pilus assembly protein PilX